MEVEPDATVIVVLGGVACEILGLNSYSNAGFNLVPAEAYDGNFEAIGGCMHFCERVDFTHFPHLYLVL